MHELQRPQSPPAQTCIPVVFYLSPRETPPSSHLPPQPLLASCCLLWAQLCCIPRLYPSNSTNIYLISPILLSPNLPSLPFVQLRCRAVPPTHILHILHVIVHSNSIFPCSIAHNTFYSMRSGGGSWSPYAKRHYRSSKRYNDTRRFVLHSTYMG